MSNFRRRQRAQTRRTTTPNEAPAPSSNSSGLIIQTAATPSPKSDKASTSHQAPAWKKERHTQHASSLATPLTRNTHPPRSAAKHQPSHISQPEDSLFQGFAPCPRGLEPVLSKELATLPLSVGERVAGGVHFQGHYSDFMLANLYSRTASRILMRIAHGSYQYAKDLYQLGLSIPWPKWFDSSLSIKVKAEGYTQKISSLEFAALTLKDAICDHFRQADQPRPNVDTRHPDVLIHIFLGKEQTSIYLDTSNEPLFKRGWRQTTGIAPLRENLAAGILLLTGYDGSQPLCDPLCGSGTFLIEAADIALGRAPGRLRRFGFEALKPFSATEWDHLKQAARRAEKSSDTLPISGSDLDIHTAQLNLEHSGLSKLVTLNTCDILTVQPNAPQGIMVSNPPYGVRMDEQNRLAEWYPQLGQWLKQSFAGWTTYWLSEDQRLPRLMRLNPSGRTPLYNGALECRLYKIEMVAGSARQSKDRL